MHTVVFGWFGGSAVWFIPLLWRLVKSMLPGGAGLRGPGTIRLWLGFVCVMVASCTLEASLIAATGMNGFGHALAAGIGRLLGQIGTPLAALALLAISLPWLIDFRWRDVAVWADGAFGLGLSRGLAKRDEEARRHRSVVDDGLTSHVSPATNTMAPKSNGRYARPTVWRPPASGRGAGPGSAGAIASPGSAAGKDAATRGAGANWRAGASTRAGRQAEPVLRTGTATPPRHVPAQTQAQAQPLNADKAAWMPTEPVAPAGWLREQTSRAVGAAAGGVGSVGPTSSLGVNGSAGSLSSAGSAGSAGSAARDSASQPGRRQADEQRPAGSPSAGTGLAGVAAGLAGSSVTAAALAKTAQAATGTAANLAENSIAHSATRVGHQSAAQGATSAETPTNRSTISRQPFPPGARANDNASTPATHRPASTAPSYTRPMPTAQKVTPPASVQETLRSIAENAARWTDIAGVSLARSSGADSAKAATASANAVPSIEEAGQSSVGAPLDSEVATSPASAPGAHATSLNLADDTAPDYPSMPEPAATPRAEAGAEASSATSHEPVVQWPIEAPAIRPPLSSEPIAAHASAQTSQHAARTITPTPFQVFAAQSHASGASTDAATFENDSTPIAATAGSHSNPHAEPAQPVDQPANPSQVTAPKLAAAATATADEENLSELHREGARQFAAPVVPLDAPTPQVAVDATSAGNSHVDATRPFGPSTALSQTSTPDALAADDSAGTATAGTQPADSPALPDVAARNGAILAAARQPESVASQPSNVVRFPGFAVRAEPSASATMEDEPAVEPVDALAASAIPAVAAAPAALAASSAFSVLETPAQHEAPVTPTPPSRADLAAEPSTETAEPAEPAEVTIPRVPLRGHVPANGFEFRAPSASMVELPTLDLLARADTDVEPVSEEKLIETGLLIEQRLQEFKVPVTVVGHSAGPVITRFEVEPALGVRGSQIVGLMKDLSRGLGLTSIRVVETIPGKTCMGLELPNAKRQTIRLSEILEASVYQNSHSQLTLAMGKDITGHPVVADLAKAPHMLVAGTTGSGKSVAINAMICSLLYKATPEEVRLIMIDPKMLELSVYEGIPHLLAPVVTDMKLAANALNWCVGEMEKRYRLMSAVGVRNLPGFNQKIRDTEAKGKKLGNPFSLTPEAPEPLAPLPLIVVVIDELADLMMVAGKKIEELIARLAQKARAAGIHLILATQRPSVDVITGLIKANIPTRVAFQVSSKIDSRTMLDQMGAESLLGQGDMLFLPPGTGYPQRVHGAFVADEEVHRIVEYLKQFGEPQYEEGILDGPATEGGAAQDLFGDSPDAEADPLYDEAVAFVVRTRRASISSVQRQLRIGYNRAARLVEQMETAGLVSAMGINGSREVLAPGPAE